MKISQREARRLRKRVAELEDVLCKQNRFWSSEWPNGVNLCNLTVPPEVYAQAHTAAKLGFAVVVRTSQANTFMVYANKLHKE